MWIVGIVMSVCYIVVFGVEALYASMGLYVYYLGMSLYGWFKWGKKTQQENRPPLRPVHMNSSTAWFSAGLLAVVFGGVWVALKFLTDHPAPAVDAAITTLNMVATWLLTRSVIEQWLLLVVANILAIILYAHTGLWFTTGLYGVYLVASVIGYMNWRRKI
jgi:nicotinamide mononucleotide transporter